jgi:very-short-patch-repair endonuclease
MASRSIHTLKFLRHLDDLAELVASIGPPCWAGGLTSAPLLGFDGYTLTPPFHLAVPNQRAPHRVGHHVHRLRDLSAIDTASAFDLPCLSATRCLIELATTETPKRLTTALDSALRDGLTTEAFLHRRIVELRRPGRAGIGRLLAVIEGQELSRGGHSFLEREFLELLGELNFPRPGTQQVVGSRGTSMIRVDCRFPASKVVVELLGYRFHRSTAQMQVDAERINRMQLDGFVVAQFTYTDVTTRSTSMLTTLEELRPRILRTAGRL